MTKTTNTTRAIITTTATEEAEDGKTSNDEDFQDIDDDVERLQFQESEKESTNVRPESD